MSNVIPLSPTTDARETAAEWIARLDRGLSHTEKRQLEQWLERDARHREALVEAAELWDKMDDLARLSALFDEPDRQPAPRRWRLPAALAACLAMLAVAIGAWLHTPGQLAQPMASQFETAVGEQVVVNLADESELTLNTNTRVSVKYSANARLLTLARGEIHVAVAHDPERPLSVIAGDKVVQAVGTAFNVRLHERQEVDLTVTEGRVRVRDKLLPSQADRIARRRLEKEASREFRHGEQVHLNGAEWQPKKLDADQLQSRLSWREGKLVFRGERLSDVLDEITRYTQTRFELADADLADIRIAGLFQAGDVEQLLSSLEQNFGLQTERVAPGKVRLARPAQSTRQTP